MTNYVIIPSAKYIASDLRKEFGHIPPVLLTYQNETILQYVHKNYRDSRILVGLCEGKSLVEQYVRKSRLEVELVEIAQPQTLGHTIYHLMQQIHFNELDQMTIHFGDTILHNVEAHTPNSILICQVNDAWRWTTVTIHQGELLFKDKTSISQQDFAVVGTIHIQQPMYFRQLLCEVLTENNTIDALFVALEQYHREYPLQLIEITRESWIDLGHLDRLIEATGQTRAFNEIILDAKKGILQKRSKNTAKFIDEILWYINLPKDLQYAVPRIFNYSIEHTNEFIEMEYYSYRSLSERYVINNLPIEDWRLIFERISNLVEHFNQFQQQTVNIDDIRFNMYVQKTLNRLTSYDWPEVLKKVSTVEKINHIVIMPLEKILNSLENVYSQLYQYVKHKLPKQFTIMHGDLCFSNILYDIYNGIMRIIDPRGSFGERSIYGDTVYDLAKLSHSVRGYYDFIIREQFYFQEDGANIVFELFTKEHHKEIVQLFEQQFLQDPYVKLYVDFIESMLFLSMIPLHSDAINRQKAMLATGILKYTQFIEQFNKMIPLKL
ncbi:aminoglycoside phosphotransferase family protein [Lysinibacillus piscis]|uniref:Capsular biosynthesis protein n=1 Tax=Lysinibacillus piscis TaxID=2518931 RepID=A0ABQ5NHP1_9BACI|nr:aminoglycoside phosphotransferase family protein [Lysinibacillus sp. KH24]GLC87794.1 hypothetical protein LYSBPC_09210 [Lysinibacillus sp. KH24]